MKVQTSLCQQLVKSVWEAINVSEINLVNVYLETELLELIHILVLEIACILVLDITRI